jgi:predicted chitinase
MSSPRILGLFVLAALACRSAETPAPDAPAAPTAGTFPLSAAQFEQLFPLRNPSYTYAGLTEAVRSSAAFASAGSSTTQRQEVAAFLAHVAHETGDLVYMESIERAERCDATERDYPCAPGQRYYGRGPIQLSWNFNYGRAGAALGLPLLADPDLVARDPAVAWQTGLWYWMTQNGPGTMTAHDAMVNGAGFGETIRSINGAIECNGGNPAQVASRGRRYVELTKLLGVPPGDNLGC